MIKDYEQLYEQMRVATQDLLIELGWSPKDIREWAGGRPEPRKSPSSKVCRKLIDAGLINK